MTGYSTTVQVRPDNPAGVTDDQLDDVTDLLAEHHGSFSADAAGGWAMTFSVNADDAREASLLALDVARGIADKARLPAGDVVRLEAVTDDVLEEELAIPNYPDLVSGPEAAAILGVSRQRVHQLATTNSRFPTPLYKLAVGSLWVRAGIEKFADEWNRKPGRRPSAEKVAKVAPSKVTKSVPAKSASRVFAKKSPSRVMKSVSRSAGSGRVVNAPRTPAAPSARGEARP